MKHILFNPSTKRVCYRFLQPITIIRYMAMSQLYLVAMNADCSIAWKGALYSCVKAYRNICTSSLSGQTCLHQYVSLVGGCKGLNLTIILHSNYPGFTNIDLPLMEKGLQGKCGGFGDCIASICIAYHLVAMHDCRIGVKLKKKIKCILHIG